MITFGFFNHAKSYSLQTIKLDTRENQFDLFKRIYSVFDYVFILESLIGPRELSEISVLGFDPELFVTVDTKQFRVVNRKTKNIDVNERVTEPLAQLKRLLPNVKDDRFRFVGGAVGYISYDAIRFWEKLPQVNSERGFPLMQFGLYRDGILYDHLENQAYYFCVGPSRLEQLKKKLTNSTNKRLRQNSFSYSRPVRNMTRAQFIKKVRRAQRYIYDGDIFQVVLSKRISLKLKGDVFLVYDSLRDVNPSPYMYFIRSPQNSILGSSPEMLIRITGKQVESFPIAGTRPVVGDEAQNETLARQLMNDEKELAEHTMLVDLARNDIGKVCQFGTVRMKELMKIKRFSHVQHIVSHVEGTLRPECDAFDTIRAVFPAGTVSGAPKVRAMEIINELETSARGPYAGALGYFSLNGCADFAITIRSLFATRNGDAYVQSGAGIVMDSDPANEWRETEFKANAVLEALRRARA